MSIGKATATVTANNQTRLFGAANPVLTQTITGFVNGENASVVTGTATGTTTATASSAVGTAAIVARTEGLSAGNYDFAASTVNAALTILPAAVVQVIADLPGGRSSLLLAAYSNSVSEAAQANAPGSNEPNRPQRRDKNVNFTPAAGTSAQRSSLVDVNSGGIKLPADILTAGSGEPKPDQK